MLHFYFRNCLNLNEIYRTVISNVSRYSSFNADFGKFDAKVVEEHCKKTVSNCKEQSDLSSNGSFTIMLPPPNVTGNLHVGHALTVAIEDSICRFNRLLGKKVSWVPGFDHAGIATQKVVETQIYRRLGKKIEEMTKEEFLEHCEKWKNERINEITVQLNALGCSLDWPKLFYTMDKNFTRAVREAFCRLHEFGLICREERMVQVIGEAEPSLKEQWFLNMEKMNLELLKHLDSEKLRLDPPTNKGKFVEFLNYKEPWNLSRQLHWGHKIPAYFVEKSKRWIVAISEEEARKKLKDDEMDSKLTQDPDVLDTWFSSSLIPIIIAGWPEKQIGEDILDLMETGHDIIGFWVARMLMMCQILTGTYPFSNILIHGLILDSQNRKMSKSLGNVVDPMDVINGVSLKRMIEKLENSNLPEEEIENAKQDLRKRFPNGIKPCGADALRFALLRHDFTDFQIHIDIPLFAEEGLRFCNKIWNMCKYVERIIKANGEINCEKTFSPKNQKDQEIIEELYAMVQIYVYFMGENRPHLAFDYLYKFILTKICDNYLESTKQSLWEKDSQRLPAICETLRDITSISLGLLQTFMPFVSTFLLDQLDLNGQIAASKMIAELPKLSKNGYEELIERMANERKMEKQHSLSC